MKIKLTTLFGVIGLSLGSLFVLACEEKGPAEKAGEEIDDKAEDVKDKLEDAGDKIEDKLDKADE